MSRSSSGFVAGLTAAAVAAVGFLAYRASASAPDDFGGAPGPGASAPGSPSAPSARPQPKDPKALPEDSGSGKRVVYALGTDRVWLVGANGRVQRTFTVEPSTVDPGPGSYRVTSRSLAVLGSDHVPVEHVVRFASVDGVTIGFSAAVAGSAPAPAPEPTGRTGGVRETRADGTAVWKFAGVGTAVVVVR